MNARVFLLVLVSALFMGAWNGDQKTIEAAIARREKLREEAWAAAANAPSVDEPQKSKITVAMQVSHRDQARPLEDTGMNKAELTAVPLPSGIAAGRYRAVSQSGVTREVNVDKKVSKASPDRDFYMVDATGGNRWYLIRIR